MKREITVKTVLQKSKLPESPFCLNPYVGCTHACAYCYARFMRRFTGHSEAWGRFVDVKVNTPAVLEQQLKRGAPDGAVLIGSVCDAYQPLEKRYKITREVVRQLTVKGAVYSVLTKSDLVMRDIDLFREAKGRCSVGISLSMHNDEHRRIFEPGAAAVSCRLKALKTLHDAGIKTYVFIGPILPCITDVEQILAATAQHTDEIWGEALNMRCGNRSDLCKAYAAVGVSDDWQSMVRDKAWQAETAHQLSQACRTHGLPLFGFYDHNADRERVP